MKLTKILLENFQAHRHTEIELDAITLITGSSDSGKSSLVRALRWGFFNRAPKGNFMLDRKGTTRVTLTYDTGDVLIRERGPKVNQYQLNGDVFKALKTDVPAEVSKFHGVTLDNCQWQLHHYFLLDETGGNVAKRLNEVADLSIMDESLKTVNALVRDADGDVNVIKTSVVGIKDQLEGLTWVPEAKELVDQGVGLQEAYSKVFSAKGQLLSVMDDITDISTKLNQFPDMSGLTQIEEVITRQQRRDDFFTRGNALVAAAEKVTTLQDTLRLFPEISISDVEVGIDLCDTRVATGLTRKNLVEIRQRIVQLQEKLDVLPDVDAMPDVEGFEIKRRDLIAGRSTLRGALVAVDKWQGKLKAAELALVDAEEAYEDLKVNLGVCPVCGNKFTEECC